jgi:hypothetical protein
MSGIVGSRFNIRGSGLVGSLGTDGQVFTSSGAGKSAVYEAAAAGGKVNQIVWDDLASSVNTTSTSYADSGLSIAITPSAADSYLWVNLSFMAQLYGGGTSYAPDGRIQITDGSNTELAMTWILKYHHDNALWSHDCGAINAYYTTGSTSEETIKIRYRAVSGRILLYGTNQHKNITTLTAMEILA